MPSATAKAIRTARTSTTRPGFRGLLGGLYHAHLGWLFMHDQRGKRSRYAPDLLADPAVRFVDRTFALWVLAGLAVPFALGWALGGTLVAGLTGLLWGGAVRMAALHHVTYSINSLCHFFGRRRFATGDRSHNLAWLALPSMGEAWHNNHHAFPTSATHGLRAWEVDPSALVIRGLEATGLAWDVQRVTRERELRALPARLERLEVGGHPRQRVDRRVVLLGAHAVGDRGPHLVDPLEQRGARGLALGRERVAVVRRRAAPSRARSGRRAPCPGRRPPRPRTGAASRAPRRAPRAASRAC